MRLLRPCVCKVWTCAVLKQFCERLKHIPVK